MRFLLLLLLTACHVSGQTGANVLLVVNRKSEVSRQIADYYRPRRSVPAENVCYIDATTAEEITWAEYVGQVETPIAGCLKKNGLEEKVLYLVTTSGVPLKIDGPGRGMMAEQGSVDSELALLYRKLKGVRTERPGKIPNPFYRQRDAPFQTARFSMYLVTRLSAYDLATVKLMIDRSLAALNRGRFVLDLNSESDQQGNDWLRTAAILLPEARVTMDQTPRVLTGLTDVIGYASWGSNDPRRKTRFPGFRWLPGAVATEYVSTNARTLEKPPDTWNITTWADRLHFFGGSPQGLSGDLLQEGATGVSGNVYEPYLDACVRPDLLFPAYLKGRNLAESFYLGMAYLSWQGVVLGDPLCVLKK
jgi:uncharacterized protein (TIGR03790 family)